MPTLQILVLGQKLHSQQGLWRPCLEFRALLQKSLCLKKTWGALALQSTLLTWRTFVVISPLPVAEAGTKKMFKHIYICKIEETVINCNKLTGQQRKALKEHTLFPTNHESKVQIVPDIYLFVLWFPFYFSGLCESPFPATLAVQF